MSFTARLLITLAAASGAALAQEQDSPADGVVETVVVTGSRIARPELEATVPTVVLDADTLEAQGFENFADIAATLPQFAPSFGTSRTQSTFSGAVASGLNETNLRNFAGIRTVALINGRRMPGGNPLTPSVDFNTIPTANIERIELITGGAASIYGADAVAGVVNIITKKDFEGIEVGASYGTSDESDNNNPNAHIMIGGSFADRGHGLFTLQYDEQGRVTCADRFLCAEDFLWTSPANPMRGPTAYSSLGVTGGFFIPNVGTVTRRNGSFTDASGQLIALNNAIDGYNRNGQRDLAIPTTRIMVAAEGELSLSDAVQVFAEMSYGSSDTDSTFEAQPFQSFQSGNLVGGGPGVPGLQASIPWNNPFVPQALLDAYVAANPMANLATDELAWQQRFAFFGARGADNARETIRGVAGFKGDLPTIGFGSDWHWELSHVYGRTSMDSITEGLVGTDRLYNALRIEPVPGAPAGTYQCRDAAARALGCIPINPFADYTPAMIDYLTLSAGQTGRSELNDTIAYLSGSVLQLPAGPLQTAVGVERRVFSGFVDFDEPINAGLVTSNQLLDTPLIEVQTQEAYIETLVPILKDRPFARSLSLEGAYRRSESDYAEVSVSYDTWKYGGEWAPLEGLRLRAMRGRSVRTPNPGDMGGGFQTFGVVQDPCTASRRGANATRSANCAADGVPGAYVAPQAVEQGVAGFVTGSRDLLPEIGTTLTYGFVLTPAFLPGFSFSVDRFQIEVDGIIAQLGRQTIVNLCYDTADRQFCDLVNRGVNPQVAGATYVLNAVDDTFDNIAEQSIAGVDAELRYRFDLSRLFGAESELGRVNTQLMATFYDKAELAPGQGAPVVDILGHAGGSTNNTGYIKRQAFLNLGYDRGPLAANWRTRYIGRAGMSPFLTGYPEIGSHAYHDARFSFSFGEGMEMFAGVNNVFDKEPPFFASGASGTQALDTIPGYYDIFGRSYYAGARAKF